VGTRAHQPRGFRFPFFRLGLLVVVGAVFASVIEFYVGLGKSLADLSKEGPSTEPRDLADHFLKNFLFAGTVPSVLFWAGIVLMAVGVIHGFGRR